MSTFPARAARALVAVVAAAALTSCAAGSSAPGPSGVPGTSQVGSPPAAATTEASAPGEGTTQAPDADPTCQTIIPAATATDFADTGLTAREDPLYIAGILLPGGIQCTWGDQSVASDQVQVYGWAPTTAELTERVEDALVADGWRQFTEAGVTYVTATGDMIDDPDPDGYGQTYRFDAGQVTVADTKQELPLVSWPPSS